MMDVVDLPIPKEAMEYVVEYGAQTLYEPQERAVKAGLLDGKSMIVSAPTASGKTLIAMLAIMSFFGRSGGRAVYLCPLRALAAEKHDELRGMENLGLTNRISAEVSVSSPDGRDRLGRGNLLIMTNERMDMAFRNSEKWLDDVGLVVADELHLIGDKVRGPTLEMVLTRLARRRPQVLGLSATITNAKGLARWLGCSLVESCWRPVALREGVAHQNVVLMDDGSSFVFRTTSKGTAADLGLDAARQGEQALIFTNTRRGAPSMAAKTAKGVSDTLTADERARLDAVSQDILRSSENTDLVKDLAGMVKSGVAFHHAGLDQACRGAVERSFRDGLIKVLSATTTLAAGINLPARRVVVSSVARYDSSLGHNAPIPVMEYKQMCGRAGRPQYDDYGEAIVVAPENPQGVMNQYVRGTPESILSRMDDMGVIHTHVLGVVVSSPGITYDDAAEFFGGTLAGMQMGRDSMGMMVRQSLVNLASFGMVEQKVLVRASGASDDTIHDAGYVATKLGRTTSRLYVSPNTANYLLGVMRQATGGDHTLGYLLAISRCAEFAPKLGLRKKERDVARALVRGHRSEIIDAVDPDALSRGLLALYHWVNEETLVHISEQCGAEPGDVHRAVETARWLVRCMARLAREVKLDEQRHNLEDLQVRVIHGVREDLVELVRIRNVGRVRARALYVAGLRTVRDVREAEPERLARICRVGLPTARGIRRAAASGA